MLISDGRNIMMAEGDFGETLPFELSGEGIEEGDVFVLKIKKNIKSEEIIKKEFTLENNCFNLSFTKEEAKKINEGNYLWGLKQYRNDKLINTIVQAEKFIVQKGV